MAKTRRRGSVSDLGFFQPAKPLLFMSPILLTLPPLFFSSSTDLEIVPGGLRRLRVLCRVLNSRLVTPLSTALSIMNQMKMIFLIHFYSFIHFFNSYSRPDLGLGVVDRAERGEGVGGGPARKPRKRCVTMGAERQLKPDAWAAGAVKIVAVY